MQLFASCLRMPQRSHTLANPKILHRAMTLSAGIYGLWRKDNHPFLAHLCLYHQDRGVLCIRRCSQKVRTFSGCPRPFAAYPACPQTASCLLQKETGSCSDKGRSSQILACKPIAPSCKYFQTSFLPCKCCYSQYSIFLKINLW